jgi:uncharacterized membrane protein
MAINVPVISTFDARGVNKAIREFQKLKTSADKTAFGLLNIDASLRRGIATFSKFAAVGLGAAGVIGSKLAQAGYEAQKAMEQTKAIIQATGMSAGVTASEVAEMSETLAMQVGIDDELIQKTANLLLTFKQVKNQVGENNDIFNRAVKTALDLGNVFGSADKAAVQLGKALADPVKGVTALRRVGINFTETQREQIKSLVEQNKLLDAQKMILDEVESQVGGTAEATATDFDRMRVAVENAAEKIGGLLLPYVERLSNFITTSVVPVINTFTQTVGEQGLGSGVRYLFGQIVSGISSMGTFGKVILGVAGAFVTLRVATIAFTATQSAFSIAANLATDAMKKQQIQAQGTKAALGVAAGAAALIGVAGIAYSIYAKRKAEAERTTRAFVDALKEEGTAQQQSLASLYQSDDGFRKLIDTAGDYGVTLRDIQQYVEQGDGKFRDLIETINEHQTTVTKDNEVLKHLRDRIDDVRKQLTMSQVAFNLATGAVENFTAQSGKAYATVAAFSAAAMQSSSVMAKYGQATDVTSIGLDELMKQLEGTTESIGKSSKATNTAKERFSKYVKSLKDYKNAKDDYVKAEKEVQKTKEDVAKATNDQAVAQAKFNQIIKGFGVGSTQAIDAQKELERAQRDAERAGYDLEKAQFAVADAEKELQNAMLWGGSTEIREAEIALAEAKLGVKDAQDAVDESTTAVNDAQKLLTETINGATESSQSYKDALKELEDANYALAQATDTANEALKRQQDAQANINQEEKQVIKGGRNLTPKERKRAERRAQVEPPRPAKPNKGKRGKAMGGSVYAGESYIVGERGREIFTPTTTGSITPNNRIGGDNINIVVNAGIGADGAIIGKEIVKVLQDYQRKNGRVPIKTGA